MSVGQRMQAFLNIHGHSYREAEAITGVSNDTIRRICKGYFGPTTPYQIGRFVAGYQAAGFQIEEKGILEGQDPRGDFEWTIRHTPAGQRVGYIGMPVHRRVRLTLSWLAARYPAVCDARALAAASGLEVSQVAALLHAWESAVPDSTTALELAKGVHRLTGISLSWFRFGWLESESPKRSLVEGARQACSGARSKPAVTKGVIEGVRLLMERI